MSSKVSNALERCRGKRDFNRTPEPPPSGQIEGGSRFAVQKHAARRLHYDLRLEFDGVLLSWAVPQRPSLIATDKRFAVRTENHPLKYLEFEGAIPKVECGGGTMIVWDRGDWIPLHYAQKSLQKGHLEFELRGQRLHGRWHLVRMKPRAGKRPNSGFSSRRRINMRSRRPRPIFWVKRSHPSCPAAATRT
jgi:bifunctional non-homologous end joining protein LigD